MVWQVTGEKKKENRAWVVKTTSPGTPSILSIWQGSDSQAVDPGVNPRHVSAREQKSCGAAPHFQSRDRDAAGWPAHKWLWSRLSCTDTANCTGVVFSLNTLPRGIGTRFTLFIAEHFLRWTNAWSPLRKPAASGVAVKLFVEARLEVMNFSSIAQWHTQGIHKAIPIAQVLKGRLALRGEKWNLLPPKFSDSKSVWVCASWLTD